MDERTKGLGRKRDDLQFIAKLIKKEGFQSGFPPPFYLEPYPVNGFVLQRLGYEGWSRLIVQT